MESPLRIKISLELKRSNESLKSAKVLVKEELYEDSISRAYYAIFHAAKAILLTIDVEPQTHEGAIRKFGHHFVKTGLIEKEIGRIFARAQKVREKSDYDVAKEFSEEDTNEWITMAEKFVRRIQEYLYQHDLLWLKENYPEMDVEKFNEIRQKYLQGELEVVYDGPIHSLKGTKYMTLYSGLSVIEKQNNLPKDYFYNRGIELGRKGKLGMIILNGGLATSYEKELGYRPTKGIFQAIMLTPISFIAIKLYSIYQYHKEGIFIPTYFMNSPATDKDTKDYLKKFNNFNLKIAPKHFCQDLGWPRIDPQTSALIIRQSGKPSIVTKGHGDVYQAFNKSGLYDEFVSQGGEILFICNIDNSEAKIDFTITGYFAWLNETRGVQIMFESAQQLPTDKKGGKCVLMMRQDGKMGPGILELTRIAPTLHDNLQEIEEFNTNLGWLHTSIDRKLFDLPFRVIKKPRLIDVDDPEISESGDKEIIQFEHEAHRLMEVVELGHSHILFVPRELRFWPNKYLTDQIKKQKELVEKYKDLYDWLFELNPQANESILPVKDELLNRLGFEREVVTSWIK